MIPSKKKIDELKEIAKQDFGVEWTDQEASEAAFNLVNYFDTLMKCAGEDKGEEAKLENKSGASEQKKLSKYDSV